MTDIRDALTRTGHALHKCEVPAETLMTFCGRPVVLVEPEIDGERQSWRVAVRDRRTCHRCDLATERRAER